jgi:SAM-dependent methyltransferase
VDGQVRYELLELHPAGLACPNCGAEYPVVDGVPLVMRSLDAWLATEAAVVFARRDLPEATAARLMRGAGGSLPREAQLVRAYRDAPPSPLHERVAAWIAAQPGLILELGCGLGVGGPVAQDRRIGLDLSFSMARAYPGRGLVGDALDPPFEAGRFDNVLLCNVLDSCRDPRVLLAQADALLRPGGGMLITCAWAWHEEVTLVAARITPEQLRLALAGDRRALGLTLQYTVEALEDPVIWRLRAGPRTVHEHSVMLLALRKSAE